jgi:hypothetical protein
MSKSNSPVKVLKTALNRIQKRWGKGDWLAGEDSGYAMCIEGAICNGRPQSSTITSAQQGALELVRDVLKSKNGLPSIPGFNDNSNTSLEDVEEVLKTAIIRGETGGPLPTILLENAFDEDNPPPSVPW